jgi:phosphate transport system substrate-binding protein
MMRRYLFVLALLLGAFLTACAPATTPTRPTPNPSPTVPLSGRLTFAGSTTVQPLVGKLGERFRELHPAVSLEIAAGGSVVGIKAIHDGSVDIGMASRSLHADEAQGIVQTQVAIDIIGIVANTTNPLTGLTKSDLRDIYLGRITRWSQLNGPDLAILVVTREMTSGTRGAFDEIILDKQAPAAPQMRTAITAGDMAAIVAAEPAAIGYVGFGNIEAGLKTLQINGVAPAEETAQAGSYPLTRPLLLLTGPLSQPLAQAFVAFVLSPEGQALVARNGWVPAR